MYVKLLIVFILTLVGIQFIPYGKNHQNPPVESEPQWNSPKTKEIFFRVCANCHSHNTNWPWYSNIAPVSWLVQHDVEEGREHFNVSKWNVQKVNRGNDAADEVEEGSMPPWVYVIGHPEAKLSEREREEFAHGLRETFGNK